MPRLSAIVPATDRPATLAVCLAAIRGADPPPDELVVVDRPERAGPARARNLGAARAGGEILVFVDADVEVHPDAFARIRAAFASDPALVALFGSYDDAPAARGTVSTFRNLLHHHVHQSSPGRASTFWAGLGAVRREAFLAAGGFDEEAFPRASIEDVELGVRLHAAGARIELDPRLQGRHHKSWSLGEMLRTDFARRGVPWVVLLARTRQMPVALNLGWRHRLSAGASLVALGAAAARRPRLAGVAALALVALNHPLYRLVARRGGGRQAVAAVGLHALHHLAAAAAVPSGLLVHLAGSARRGRRECCPTSRRARG